MNKKIIISSLLVWTLALTSCGTKKLGTFEEEIKAEQNSYVANINKFFANTEEFMEGKFTSKMETKASVDVPNELNAWLDLSVSGKTALEKTQAMVDYSLGLGVNYKINEKATAPELARFAGTDANAKADLKLGFDGSSLYLNLKSLDFDAKWTEQIAAQVKNLKTQYDALVKPYTNKWYFFDFSTLPEFENVKKEMERSLTWNKQAIAMIKEGLTTLVSGDIFTKAEKTTFEGKEAYKFAIDEEKLKAHLISTSKNLSEKYKDFFESQGLTQSFIAENIKDMETDLKDKKFIKSSELYLTKSSDGTANIFVKNLEIYENDTDVTKVELSILEKNIKAIFTDSEKQEIKLDLAAEKGGKINYDIVLNTEKVAEFAKINWFYKLSKSGKTMNTEADFNVNFKDVKKVDATAPFDIMTLKANIKSTDTKDDSIVINKETITEKSTEVVSITELLSSFGLPIGAPVSVEAETPMAPLAEEELEVNTTVTWATE